MKDSRRLFKSGLIGLLMAVACAAGLSAETVTVTGELRGEVDATEIHAKLDTIDAKLDRVLDHLATPPTPDPEPQTPDPEPPSGGDDPVVVPGKATDLWINVSHFGDAPAVTPRGDGTYDIDPRFVELMSQFAGIRYLDWTGQLHKGFNWSWAERVTDHDVADWRKTGLPLEAIIATANATKTHIWWTAPQQADLDYMRRAGDLFAATLDPQLDVVIEIGNEVWQSNRGWRYDQLSNGDYAERMRLYATDAAAKFQAFKEGDGGGGFPADRLTRVIGGQLHNIGVLESHALKHIRPDQFDGITVSGYFGNKAHRGEHWRTGDQGLVQSMGYLEDHARLAESIGKPLLIYELNSHVEQNRDLFNSDAVIDGVQAMIDKAHALGVKRIAIYAGAGVQNEKYHWPSYTPDYQPNPIAQRLGWPTINNN